MKIEKKEIINLISLGIFYIFLFYILTGIIFGILDFIKGYVFEDNAEWIGYYGSAFSGLIGGSLTLIGVMLTIRFYRSAAKRNEEIDEERMRISVKPYLKVRRLENNRCKIKSNDHYVLKEIKFCEDGGYGEVEHEDISILIKNIGNNSAINMSILEGEVYAIRASEISCLEKNERFYWNINLQYTFETLMDYKDECCLKDDKGAFVLKRYNAKFTDIAGTKYYQEIHIIAIPKKDVKNEYEFRVLSGPPNLKKKNKVSTG